jgi:hypothetical protein
VIFVLQGSFGPDIEEFVMKLPEYFPQRAGQAQNALRFQLSEFTKTMQKINEEKVPTTMEETIEPTLYRSLNKWLDKREMKRELQRKIEEYVKADASMYLVYRSSYPARRRNAMGELPGFTRHYPNPLYTAPALPWFTFLPEQVEKRSLVGSLFGNKVQDTTVLAPVGRRTPVQHANHHDEHGLQPVPGGTENMDTNTAGASAQIDSSERPSTAASGIIPRLVFSSPMSSMQGSPVRSTARLMTSSGAHGRVSQQQQTPPSTLRGQGSTMMYPPSSRMMIGNRPGNLSIQMGTGRPVSASHRPTSASIRPSPGGASTTATGRAGGHSKIAGLTSQQMALLQQYQMSHTPTGAGTRRPSTSQQVPMLGAIRGKQSSSQHNKGWQFSSGNLTSSREPSSGHRAGASVHPQQSQQLLPHQQSHMSTNRSDGTTGLHTHRKPSLTSTSMAANLISASIRNNNVSVRKTYRSVQLSNNRVTPTPQDEIDAANAEAEAMEEFNPLLEYLDENGNLVSGFEQRDDGSQGMMGALFSKYSIPKGVYLGRRGSFPIPPALDNMHMDVTETIPQSKIILHLLEDSVEM